MKKLLRTLPLGLALCASAVSAAYPDQPIRLVVPYLAGGSTDLVARTTAQFLSKKLSNTVIVENKPGANTIVAAQYVAKAAPDGYTLLLAGSGAAVLNPLLYKKLPYNVDADFAPIGMLSNMPFVMIVNPNVPAKSVKDFVQFAKTNPGGVNYGTAGNGNPMHVAGALFKSMSDIPMQQIPYNGSAPAIAALIGGDVNLSFEVLATALPFMKAGKVRAIAVTSKQRNRKLPDLPTMIESGFPGFEASTWFALMVPSKTPDDIQVKLRTALGAVLIDPDFVQALDDQTLIAYPPMSAAETRSFFASERERWKKVIDSNGISLD